MRRYETFVIMDSELTQDQRDQVIQRVDELIGQMDGFLAFTDDWGERKLAYNIKKRARGYYVRFDYCGLSPLVNEIERFFRIDDRVLKYMTVLLDEAVDLEKIKEEQAMAESSAQMEETPKKASLAVEPAPLEAPRKTEAAPEEAARKTEAAPLEAARETEAAPLEAARETEAAPLEAPRKTEAAPLEAPRKTEAAPLEAPRKTEAAPLEAPRKTEAAPQEAVPEVEPAQNKQEDIAPTSDAGDSAADKTPLKNPEEA